MATKTPKKAARSAPAKHRAQRKRTHKAPAASVPAVRGAQGGVLVAGFPAFIISKVGVMRWQRATMRLTEDDSTVVPCRFGGKTVYAISAEGYRRLNQIARVMVVQAPELDIAPVPPAPVDVVTVRGAGIGYIGGSVQVRTLTMRYDVRSRALVQFVRLAQDKPAAAKMGTAADKPADRWAYYPCDEVSGVWLDMQSEKVLTLMCKLQESRVMCDRVARTHWERNLIRSFLPAIPPALRNYDTRKREALVTVEGYYPDHDAEQVRDQLVAIAQGKIDPVSAHVHEMNVVLGPADDLDSAIVTAEEVQAAGETAGDPLMQGTDAPANKADERGDLLRAIDTACFFQLTPNEAKALTDKYAPFDKQPTDKLRAIVGALQTAGK